MLQCRTVLKIYKDNAITLIFLPILSANAVVAALFHWYQNAEIQFLNT